MVKSLWWVGVVACVCDYCVSPNTNWTWILIWDCFGSGFGSIRTLDLGLGLDNKNSETTETIPVFACIVLGVSLFRHEYSALLRDSVIIVCPRGSTSCVRPNISVQIIFLPSDAAGVKTLRHWT